MSTTSFPLCCDSGGAGELNLLNTTTISSPTTQFQIDNIFTGYDRYEIRYYAILSRPSVGTGRLALQIGQNGSYLTTNYQNGDYSSTINNYLVIGETSGGSLNTLDTRIDGLLQIWALNSANAATIFARWFNNQNVAPATATPSWLGTQANRPSQDTRQSNNSIKISTETASVLPVIEEAEFKFYGFNL